MLTGKALKDFIEYHYNQVDFTKESHEENYELFLANTEDIHQLASVVDWLDSVRIYVETGVYPKGDGGTIEFSWSIFGEYSIDDFELHPTRQQATEQAIIMANKIYNE